MATRPHIRADGPSPSAPLRGLLAVAQTLEDGDVRWENGVTLDPHPCGVASVWDPTCDPTPTAKVGDEYDEPVDAPAFEPFVVYQARKCSTLGQGPFNEFVAKLTTTLDATQHFGIEHEFWTGDLIPANPHLDSADADVLDPEAVQITDAFAVLETAIADSGRAGMIHVTPATGVWASRFNLISLQGQVMRTALGTPVVIGAGYQGTGPGGETPPEGSHWLYATGPVRVRLGATEVMPATISEATDRRFNRTVVRAERPVLVEWDQCLHVGQLAVLGEQSSTFAAGSGS